MERKTESKDTRPSILPSDPAEIARIEARNALLQFDRAMDLVDIAVSSLSRFKLTISCLCELNRLATEGIIDAAGALRQCSITISNSHHCPPPWQDVPKLIEEMCDYVHDQWEAKSPIHLAAYVLWRLNWIHPFRDGNGRTARMSSYLVLCIKLGFRIPGSRTIPEQISKDKTPYYKTLENADAAFANGAMDVSEMEQLLSILLAAQLMAVHDEANGR